MPISISADIRAGHGRAWQPNLATAAPVVEKLIEIDVIK